MIDLMHRQDNMYHVYLEGIENKRPKKDVRLVKSIMDSFNPYVDYAKYEAYFLSPELKITISNTTEAGIRYEEGDDLTACPPKSYPAKMTALLYKRFKHFNGDPTKGLCIICCELIENNGVDDRLANGHACIHDALLVGDVDLPVHEGSQEVAFAELQDANGAADRFDGRLVQLLDHCMSGF